uniref:RING-type E3 ubiquitin transferase n=1 Tax=Latimeria chalumnae TaxID=7897 RepID=H3AJ71_LATCH
FTMDGRTVCVDGLPTEISQDRVKDKLFIHFLRPRNGGGEVTDIVILPDSPTSALITFEDVEAVAQQVLRKEKHVLSIHGKDHQLKVSPLHTDPNLEEIFIKACITINYGRLKDGEKVMKNIKKLYKDVQFGFDRKEEVCTVKGTFTEVQNLCKEIINIVAPGSKSPVILEGTQSFRDHSLQTGDPRISGISKNTEQSSSTNNDSRSQASDISSEILDFGSIHDDATIGLHLEGDNQRLVGGFEDISLMMDSDIYVYMQKFYKEKYQEILYKHKVEAVDITNDGLTTVYLQATSESSSSVNSLRKAHQTLLNLYHEFEVKLRKEQINKKDVASNNDILKKVSDSMKVQFPTILFHEDKQFFYLIGKSSDVSQAKQYMLFSHVEEQAAKSDREQEASFAAHNENLSPVSTRQVPVEPRSDQQLRRSNSIRQEEPKECKLAVNFSVPEYHQSKIRHVENKSSLLHIDKDVPINTQFKSHLSDNGIDLGAFSGKISSVGTCHMKDLKSPDKANEDVLFKRVEGSSGFTGRLESKFFHHSGGTKSSGPIKPMSNSLLHLDLEDNLWTGKDSAKATTDFQFKTGLRRTNSFSGIMKSKESSSYSGHHEVPAERNRESSGTTEMDDWVTEDASFDAVLWLYLRDIYNSYITSITCKEGVEVTELKLNDITVLKIKGQNKLKVSSAKMGVESLYNREFKQFTHQLLSYSELGVKDQTDENLDEWCKILKINHEKVKISKTRNGLWIMGPDECCLQVIQELKMILKSKFKYHTSYILGTVPTTHPSLLTENNLPKESVTTESTQDQNSACDQALQPNSNLCLGEVIHSSSQLNTLKEKEGYHFTPNTDAIETPNQMRTSNSVNKNSSSQATITQTNPNNQIMSIREKSSTSSVGQQQESTLSKCQSRSPAVGQDEQDTKALKCQYCRKGDDGMSNPHICHICGHIFCKECVSGEQQRCPICFNGFSSLNKNTIKGTMNCDILSQSLTGYPRDLTIKLIYNIPDGVQSPGDPNPGKQYKGGRFEAFLPENKDGKKVLLLLNKAFDRGLTFKIRSFDTEDRVTWGCIPHKTSLSGGKAKNGYPDSLYLKTVCEVLRTYGIE